MKRPPRWAEAVLSALLPAAARDEVLGDLAESYASRSAHGPLSAKLWYTSQVLLVPAWMLGSALLSLRFDPAEVGRTLRGLARAPGFTLVAVVSLGLGIGATTAIAGALHGLLFLSLPVDRPEELSLVYHSWPDEWNNAQYGSSSTVDPVDGEDVVSNVSFPAWEVLTRNTPPEVALAGYAFVRELSLVVGDGPALAAGGMLVSGNYFPALGLETELGRALDESDDRPGAAPVAVLSHSFWQRAFGGDPGVIGQTVRLNGDAFEIVGVAQKGYVGLSPGGFFGPSEVIATLSSQPTFIPLLAREGESARTDSQLHWVRILARIPAAVDRAGVRQRWNQVLGVQMVEGGVFAEGDVDDMEVRLLEGQRGLDSLRASTGGPLRILSAAVFLVLLIACANLTTLLLARGAARTEELALRRALGASRWELARPQIVESLLLGLVGGAIGFVVALQGGPLLVSSLTGGAGASAVRYEVNGVLIGSATLAALVAAGLSGWLPALRMMRTDPQQHLGARSLGGSARHFRLGRGLIAAQIAISVPLVVGAGLFLRTLGNLVDVDLGFDPEGLVVFRVDASLTTRDEDEQTRLYRQILDDLQSAPGVRAAAIVENILVSGWQSNTSATVDGERAMLDMNAVSPDFFETMGIELLSGRRLDASDDADAPAVALVNETAERELFGGRALGRHFEVGGSRQLEVVGVVSDAKYSSLRGEIEPGFYDPWVQRPGRLYTAHYVARTDGPVAALEPVIRRIVADADPGLPVTALRSQDDAIAAEAAQERVFARLLSAFGAFALLLSCIGLHGLMSFIVAQRTSEMGVRLALGAAPVSIVRMVLGQVARLTVAGLLVGLVLASQVAPVVRTMLYGVEPVDGRTMIAAAAVMALVAVLAGAMPAIRAARVDPLKSLSP